MLEYIISKLIKKMRLRSIKNSIIDKSSDIETGTLFVNSVIGKNSFIGYDCEIINSEIGSFCSIANGCVIGGESHSIEWLSTSPVFNKNKDQIKKKYSLHEFETSKKTIIGSDVWIGARALIKAGVNVGNGSIVGMGSVVVKDIPTYEIWAGNPAKFIRKRFSDDICESLSEMKWWNFSDEELYKYAKYANDVSKFIENVKRGQNNYGEI